MENSSKAQINRKVFFLLSISEWMIIARKLYSHWCNINVILVIISLLLPGIFSISIYIPIIRKPNDWVGVKGKYSLQWCYNKQLYINSRVHSNEISIRNDWKLIRFSSSFFKVNNKRQYLYLKKKFPPFLIAVWRIRHVESNFIIFFCSRLKLKIKNP